MIFKQFIDRASVRKNPQAGSTDYFVAGRTTVSVSFSNGYPNLNTRFEGAVVERCSGNPFVGSASLIYHGENPEGFKNWIHAITPVGSAAEVKYHQDGRWLHSMYPAPDYLFDYLPCAVQCEECKHAFMADDLESDDNREGDYNNCVCPNCGVWDCCAIVTEELADVLHEQEQTRKDEEPYCGGDYIRYARLWLEQFTRDSGGGTTPAEFCWFGMKNDAELAALIVSTANQLHTGPEFGSIEDVVRSSHLLRTLNILYHG